VCGHLVHDLRHCWFTSATLSKVCPHIADAILGHGDNKETLQSVYLSLSDDDLVGAIHMIWFDVGETET